MSEQGTAVPAANATATAAATAADANKPVAKLVERFGKYGKLIAHNGDTAAMTALSALVDTLSVTKNADGTTTPNAKFHNWTEKAPDGFDSFALVKCEETDKDGDPVGEHFGDYRLIPIASWDLVKDNAVVAAWLQRAYENKVCLRADKDEAQEADFIVVDGAFKFALDDDAFDAVAKAMISLLKEKGLHGITKSTLRLAFSNSAFAESTFPRVRPEVWSGLINMGKNFAAGKGLNVAIFDYWLQTRDARDDAGGEIDIELDAFGAEFAKVAAEKEAAKKAAPAPAATAEAATAPTA